MVQLIDSYEADREVKDTITEETLVTMTKSGHQQYHIWQGLLQYQGKLVFGDKMELRRQVSEELRINCSGMTFRQHPLLVLSRQ